jgi:hypothetical protein
MPLPESRPKGVKVKKKQPPLIRFLVVGSPNERLGNANHISVVILDSFIATSAAVHDCRAAARGGWVGLLQNRKAVPSRCEGCLVRLPQCDVCVTSTCPLVSPPRSTSRRPPSLQLLCLCRTCDCVFLLLAVRLRVNTLIKSAPPPALNQRHQATMYYTRKDLKKALK